MSMDIEMIKKKGNHLILEKAKRELAYVDNKYKEQQHQFILRQFQEAQKALKKPAQDLAYARAKLRFENSKEIVGATISDSRNYAKVVDLYKKDWFDSDRFDEFVQTVRILESFRPETPYHGNKVYSPIITSCPNPLTLGEQHTLLGLRFGASKGEIRIEAKTEPSVIYPEILNWSDTAVRFIIPTSIKIPFSAPGELTLKRLPIAGGLSHGWTFNPDTRINVVLESKTNSLFYFSNEYSESGENNRAWEKYEKIITLSSPLLPEAYRLFTQDYLTAEGLLLTSEDSVYYIMDSRAKIELMKGPYESGNSLHVNLKITDDWHRDYTVRAVFYIIVPDGYPVPNGWSHI